MARTGGPKDALPTTARVLSELSQREIAHFACHGTHERADPSLSRLLLHDHADHPLTVAALAPVNLERAQLAYLSACESALTTHGDLLDESIHLTSAFQLAGFPHVVGTLWSIDDETAVEIADEFYTGLRNPTTGLLDTTRAADALHRAVRSQRDWLTGTPFLWAAYLHAGA